MKHIFTSEIKNGRMSRRVANDIAICLQSFEGKSVEVSIAKKKKSRSNEQNKYYWSCVVPILRNHLNELGNKFSVEQTHDLLKFKFLKEAVRVNDDEFIDRIKSTTELSTTEFMEFILEIQEWCLQMFDLTIPAPNEQVNLEL
jgi:hypothetical protein